VLWLPYTHGENDSPETVGAPCARTGGSCTRCGHYLRECAHGM